MRTPRTPPSLDELQRELLGRGPTRLLEVLDSANAPTLGGRYLHWDELRRRRPPEGLDHDEWWFALAFQRRARARPLPLRDRRGCAFSYVLADPIPERLHEIDLGAGGPFATPSIADPETRAQYSARSLIQEAITSSHLEGATTTQEVAEAMLRSGRPPRDRSEQMILDNHLAMRRIRELGDDDLSRELLFELHRLVIGGALDETSAAGRLRTAEERVVVADDCGEVLHLPPNAGELDDRLEAMLAFANDRDGPFVHPVVRSILLHFWLAYDHPFVDGNGRTARALFYWSMLRHGYGLFELISISATILKAPNKYYRAFLHSETAGNDATYFLLHQIAVIDSALCELRGVIERRTRDLHLLAAKLRGFASLNHRQQALIGHALRHPDAEYTIAGHQSAHDVVYQTARTDLLDLEHRGLLTSSKRGRTFHFQAAPKLQHHLRNLD